MVYGYIFPSNLSAVVRPNGPQQRYGMARHLPQRLGKRWGNYLYRPIQNLLFMLINRKHAQDRRKNRVNFFQFFRIGDGKFPNNTNE